VDVMNVHVNSGIVTRVGMVKMMQLQPLQLALIVRQWKVIKYVELVNDDVQVVHAFPSIVLFHDPKGQDQSTMDLEKQMIRNQLFLDEEHYSHLQLVMID
jgi:hypothetical protein